MSGLRFTVEDANHAYETWGANCGPGAIAAIMGLTLQELRPHLGDFERKHYTNPTMMWQILRSLGARWYLLKPPGDWPLNGLVRVQWEGPWTAPGVPMRARYKHTHWVAARTRPHGVGVFDINAMNSGGWIGLQDWSRVIVPWILKDMPRSSGGWHMTHVVEIEQSSA